MLIKSLSEKNILLRENVLSVCKLYFEDCNLFIRKGLYYLIKSLVRHLQFIVGRKHNLVGHLILPQFFSIGQNVRCVFRLVGQFLILVIVKCRTVVLGPRYRKGRMTWNGLKEAIYFMVQVILTVILQATLYIYVVCTLYIRIYYTRLFFDTRKIVPC